MNEQEFNKLFKQNLKKLLREDKPKKKPIIKDWMWTLIGFFGLLLILLMLIVFVASF